MEIINKRRSVRQYLDKKIEPEKVEAILRAAMQAPSAVNQQPWEFVIVEDQDQLQKIADMSPYAKMAGQAPLAIIMLGDFRNLYAPDFWQQDMGAAAQNLMLEAVNQDLGTVWLGVHPDPDRSKHLIEAFALPDYTKPYGVIVVGYPASEDANKYVDRFVKEKVHYNKY